jgi:hypothetical protein
MGRKLKNWIESYLEYADHTEAPRGLHFWTAASVIAGALRRKVWLNLGTFKWYPGMYVIIVAKPGIVSKTTTIDIGMDILREIPGIKFGPDIITMASMMTTFAASGELFECNGEWLPMSAITFASGELGNLLNPQDKDMVNALISLWDGKKRLEKTTKTSGSDTIEAPWINLIAATTPHWIAENMPSGMIGGGFTSRCIFVYADRKERYVPYPMLEMNGKEEQLRLDLIDDLNSIAANLVGDYNLTAEAAEWGYKWYIDHWTEPHAEMDDERFEGYLARKQAHLHKLAIILSASRSDDQLLTINDLQLADTMLQATEGDLLKVFSRIGRSQESLQVEQFLAMIKKRGEVPYEEAYRYVHTTFQDFHDFEGTMNGAIRAGYVQLVSRGAYMAIKWSLVGDDKSYHL